MKKLIIHNETNVELLIVTDESGYFVDGKDKVTIETNSKRVYIKNKNAPNAKIMFGLGFDNNAYVVPSWGFLFAYLNSFDSYFDVSDVFKEVFVTAHCYEAHLSGSVLFNVYKVISANKEVQKLEYKREKDRKLFKLFFLIYWVPWITVTSVISIFLLYGLIFDFDIYFLLACGLIALFLKILFSVRKDAKMFYHIEENQEKVMGEAEKVEIYYINKWYVKYRNLTPKYSSMSNTRDG